MRKERLRTGHWICEKISGPALQQRESRAQKNRTDFGPLTEMDFLCLDSSRKINLSFPQTGCDLMNRTLAFERNGLRFARNAPAPRRLARIPFWHNVSIWKD